jgi:O-antigen biosynthesis protein
LDHRFPHFRRECAAFVDSDPLRSCRENIERQLTPSNTPKPPVLVLSGIGALRAVTASRVDQLVAEGHFVIVLEVVPDNEGKRIRLSAAGGSAPQSLSFGLSTTAELDQWRAYLGKLRPAHCEMMDTALMAPQLKQTFSDMDIPVDFWVADGTSVAAGLAPERQKQAPPRADNQALDSSAPDDQAHKMISGARRILAPSALAKIFTTQVLPGQEIHILEQPIQAALLPEPSRQRARQLAIVPARSSANELLIIRSLALRLRGRHQDVSIFVAGSTFDDLRLMSHDNVFVSGPIEASELGRVLLPHNVGWMLTGFDGPLFGHPLIEAARGANVPVAYLDWSRGAAAGRAGDLAMDPDLRNDQLVDQITTWIEGT